MQEGRERRKAGPQCYTTVGEQLQEMWTRPLRCWVPAYMATCNNLEGGTFQAKKYKRKTKWLKNDQYQIKPWVEGVWLLNDVYRDAQENIWKVTNQPNKVGRQVKWRIRQQCLRTLLPLKFHERNSCYKSQGVCNKLANSVVRYSGM